MEVKPIAHREAGFWEAMRQALWASPEGEHAAEIARFFGGDRHNRAEVLLAFDASNRVAGFVELSIRPYAEKCHSGHVAYVEGWYVDPSCRRTGVGAALIKGAEAWALDQGCKELASDAALDNEESAASHLSLGFEETGRIICFRKDL